jgi:hypothetical protein
MRFTLRKRAGIGILFYRLLVRGALFLLTTALDLPDSAAMVNDVTSSVDQLGNPANAAYPGNDLGSVPDLQFFEGKVFMGYGNTDNVIAKRVLYYDPVDGALKTDSPTISLNDEILRRFRVFNDKMYVESFDPIELSNLYVRHSAGWTIKPMQFPGSGRHNFDIYRFENTLFTGGGFGFPGIAVSLDEGTTWMLPGASVTNVVFNNSEFFEFAGRLYVSQDLTLASLLPDLDAPFLLKYVGGTNTPFVTVHAHPTNFFPFGDLNQGKVSHFQQFSGKGVFIANGSLYVAASIEPPALTKVILPNGVPDCAVDLLSRSNGVYFLACLPQLSNLQFPYLGVIGKSENLQDWQEICRFGTREVVESFEMVNGDFLVGLGNYVTTTNSHSGDMLRIPRLAANEEHTAIVPKGEEFPNSHAGSVYPFGLGVPVRYQQVYLSSAVVESSEPCWITGLAFRSAIAGGSAFSNFIPNVRIDFSTTTASPLLGWTTQFAAQTGADVTTVKTGALLLASSFVGPVTSRNAFDVQIAFQKPFFYDPSKGNLLLDIYNYSGGDCPPLDSVWSPVLPSARLIAADAVDSETGALDAVPTGLLTKFFFRPASYKARRPVAFAGFSQTITLPDAVSLTGTAQSQDPPNLSRPLTNLWSKVTGPGQVAFSNDKALSTAASFSVSGVYVLRLAVGVGELAASSDLTVNVLPTPLKNLSPVVDAGSSQRMAWINHSTGATNTASLNGLIADDGYPQPPGITTSLWAKISGPGSIAFASPTEPLTKVRFSAPGEYVVRLMASDGERSSNKDVAISVVDTPGDNQAPAVNAGPDLSATQLKPVRLQGQVSDDGYPDQPGTVSSRWTKARGPGTVTFADPTNSATWATFSRPGDYVLRLTASDREAESSDETIVQVLEGKWVVVPNNLATTEGRSGNGYPFNLTDSVRFQQVYAASQFPSTPGPVLISEIAFRPSATSGTSFTNVLPWVTVELSTTAARPTPGLSPVFADNTGPDRQIVFDGPLVLSSGFSGAKPKVFDIVLPLRRAFHYDPNKGNLLLDIKNFSGSTTTYLDVTWGTGISSSRIVSRVGGVGDDRGISDTIPTALVTQFLLCLARTPELSISRGSDRVTIQYDSVAGQRLLLETSTNLVDWSPFQTNLPLFQNIEVNTLSPLDGHRFYRGQIAP